MMEVKDFFCQMYAGSALKPCQAGQKTEDMWHYRPRYQTVVPWSADAYETPEEWLHGGRNVSSYFIGMNVGTGFMFDFGTEGDTDYAVVVSVQGVNSLTGRPADGVYMERYVDNCPVHKKPFYSERYCKDCGFWWPAQNYATRARTGLYGSRNKYVTEYESGSQNRMVGFRSGQDVSRQFVVTDKPEQGVAAHLIGEDRVQSIGIAFFKGKDKFMRSHDQPRYCRNCGDFAPAGKCERCATAYSGPQSERPEDMPHNRIEIVPAQHFEIRDLDIGMGAKMRQFEVEEDEKPQDYWDTEPAAMIFLQFTDVPEAREIQAKPRKLDAQAEGFLDGMPLSV